MKKLRLLVSLLLIFTLHAGVIRKERTPIQNTQTDPIALKKKLEELKDGEKGPPTPTFEFYEGRNFQTKSPVGNQPEEAGVSQPQDHIPDFGDPVPENLEGVKKEPAEDDWWAEGWGQDDTKKDAGASKWEEKW